MDTQNVDLARLVAELRSRADESRAWKKVLRAPWTEPMADIQRALVACRRRTTDLLILRAWLRGRMHLQRPPRDGATPGMPWDRARHHALVAARVAAELAIDASASVHT